MTLEYLIQNAEPADTDSGTLLSNTVVLSVTPVRAKTSLKEAISVKGTPIVRFMGFKSPNIAFQLVIKETGARVQDKTFGLGDLYKIRLMAAGDNGSSIGNTVWIDSKLFNMEV